MPSQTSTFSLPYSTGANVQDPTTYKSAIDAAINATMRLGGAFSPSQSSTANMKVAIFPGSVYSGVTLTEIGSTTSATLNSTTTATVASSSGLSGTMLVTGRGIPNGTTATNSGTTVTLSQAATVTGSNVPLTFWTLTGTITAPVTNPRIDRIVVDKISGAISVITGSESATPSAPAITSGKAPIAQVLLQTSTTSISNSMITDERNLRSVGSSTPNTYSATPANPTGNSSATAKMQGLAGTLTPVETGVIEIIIAAEYQNSNTVGGPKWQIRYGTGSAPANGDALTGTAAGRTSQIDAAPAITTNYSAGTLNAIVTGLTIGTAYWIDVSLAQPGAGTASLKNIGMTVKELK